MVIRHNMLALYSSRQLGVNNKKLKTNMEKLSSGYKINRAADDAAGLAISEKMRRQIRGLNQGTENMQDGISWVQIGDGAMEEIADILHRMTELSVKGANGTLSASDREAIDEEIQHLKVEINRINETTKFNDMRIFSTDNSSQEEIPEFTIKGLTGDPDDLDIFNATYDYDTRTVTYGGILFHGNRISWDAIDSNMVYDDGGTQRFREGIWEYTDAQNRTLIFSAKEGDEVPAITRRFNITAEVTGLNIDGELIRWSDIRNETGEAVSDTGYVNGTWTAAYNGMTLSFEIKKAYGGFYGLAAAINGGHDDVFRYQCYARYAGSIDVQAVDAGMHNGVQVSNDIAEKIENKQNYILRADDNGLWLTLSGSAIAIAGSEKSWAQMGITSWDSGDDIRENHDYHYTYDSLDANTHIDFAFTLDDITSSDSVIDGLDGVELSFFNVTTNYGTELNLQDLPGSNVVSGKLTANTVLSFENERALNRDFDVRQCEIGKNAIQYAAGMFILSYADDTGQNVIVYEGNDTAVRTEIANFLDAYEKQVITAKTMQALYGLPSDYNLEPKDLKDYLGGDKITTSGKLNDTVEITDDMVMSDGNGSFLSGEPGKTYGCGTIDFSGINTEKEIWELTGSGFDSTCNTCDRHYSVQFVLDTPGGSQTDKGFRYNLDKTDHENPVLQISVSSLKEGTANSVDPGKEIAEAIVEIASQGFDDHFQQYAAKDGKLYVYDNRTTYSNENMVRAAFYTTPYKKEYQNNYSLKLESESNGTQLIQYQYDHGKYGEGISVVLELDSNGAYGKNADGTYETYNSAKHSDRYGLKVSYRDGSGGDVDREKYVEEAINKAVSDMVDVSEVTLASRDFTMADFCGEENLNIAVKSSFSAYFSAQGYIKPGEKMLETIRIQKSGDVPNYLSIPKFALNVNALGLSRANCLTRDASRDTIDMVSYALKNLSSKRSVFGALQNRLEHAINSNENTSENTTTAESRIRDTDMAEEMISLSNNQFISQSIQSMLAQSNQSKQGVLNLLG